MPWPRSHRIPSGRPRRSSTKPRCRPAWSQTSSATADVEDAKRLLPRRRVDSQAALALEGASSDLQAADENDGRQWPMKKARHLMEFDLGLRAIRDSNPEPAEIENAVARHSAGGPDKPFDLHVCGYARRLGSGGFRLFRADGGGVNRGLGDLRGQGGRIPSGWLDVLFGVLVRLALGASCFAYGPQIRPRSESRCAGCSLGLGCRRRLRPRSGGPSRGRCPARAEMAGDWISRKDQEEQTDGAEEDSVSCTAALGTPFLANECPDRPEGRRAQDP
jgi:hypothetical protein